MTILVEFRISTDRFELGSFIGRQTGVTGELERIVPTEKRAIPYVWATGTPDALAALTDTFETSDKTEAVAILDELQVSHSEHHQYLYRVEWILDELDIIKGIIDADGAILEGESAEGYWYLRFRFSDHSDVADFYQYLADNGITDFSIDSLYELRERAGRGSQTFTDDQREALTLAAERGYFDMPRQTSLDAIGEELGITQQATSERIRRGVRNGMFELLNIPTASENP